MKKKLEGVEKSSKQGVSMQEAVEMDMEVYEQVTKVAKEGLFRRVKFISNKKQQLAGFNPGSICHYVATECGVREADRKKWWMTYRVAIPRAITDTRNSKSGAIKKALLGK